MLSNSKALVVDDKYDDGALICSRLRETYVPYYFFHFDQEKLLTFAEEKKQPLNGIRLIFQDLQLVSADAPNKDDYDAAAETIDTLLSDNNGPWLLVTWSTWSGDKSGYGTTKANELFKHLCAELPPGKKPFSFVALDTKPTFTSSGLHSEVKKEIEIPDEMKKTLESDIKEKTGKYPALTSLVKWEVEAIKAIAATVSEVTSFIPSNDFYDSDLGSILHEMALAEIGKNVSSENLSKGLKEILSSVLRDKIGVTSSGIESFERINEEKSLRLDHWKEKTNRVVHFELANSIRPFPPGSIFSIKQTHTILPQALETEAKMRSFLRQNFLSFSASEKRLKDQIASSCDLVALDMTPPCDHAQNKSTWNKYIVGIKIPKRYIDFCYGLNKSRDHNGTIIEERAQRLNGEYLIKLPDMADGGEIYSFVFNSKLTFSLNSDESETILENGYLGRLREQILSDLTSWLIRQSTRPGIVELR